MYICASSSPSIRSRLAHAIAWPSASLVDEHEGRGRLRRSAKAAAGEGGVGSRAVSLVSERTPCGSVRRVGMMFMLDFVGPFTSGGKG